MTARLILLVGGGADLVSLCERAAPSLPLVRARFVGTAVEFVRTMRPAIALVAPEMTVDDRNELHAVAAKYGVTILAIRAGESESELGAAIRRAVDEGPAAGSVDSETDSGLLPFSDESSRGD